MSTFEIQLNNKTTTIDAEADIPVLWAIRDIVGLTGTKFGCGIAQCGACTMLLNGEPIRSCVTPLSSVVGQKLTTIEGLDSKVGEAVQKAWQELSVPQCGYCQSGQILAATALLTRKVQPSEEDVNTAMSGNICRCGTYNEIKEAIHKASASLKKGAHV